MYAATEVGDRTTDLSLTRMPKHKKKHVQPGIHRATKTRKTTYTLHPTQGSSVIASNHTAIPPPPTEYSQDEFIRVQIMERYKTEKKAASRCLDDEKASRGLRANARAAALPTQNLLQITPQLQTLKTTNSSRNDARPRKLDSSDPTPRHSFPLVTTAVLSLEGQPRP